MSNNAIESESWRTFNVMVVSPTPTHPQDYGNRKRIFSICTLLRALGAKIHFVHYPAEHDWRHSRPASREKQMIAAWDTYQLVAPSRPLHASSTGLDHGIDEWADPNLTNYLEWAFRLCAYDMVIVNYTWMSFCFEAVPANVLKVCDTHDVFGNRRKLLQFNGIAPEFFHTTPEDEGTGLRRADLVWAIKPSEEAYFRETLGINDCITMLHREYQEPIWRDQGIDDGWLTIGILAANNNINRINIENFLTIALPMFIEYMAPVKIVIAGSICDELKEYVFLNIEKWGRRESLEEFYTSIDVAVIPMTFSTGLKIKVSEALSMGVPVVATAHAMEGYPSEEPQHSLHGFDDIALELVKLSFDRQALASLAVKSLQVNDRIAASVGAAMKATRTALLARRSSDICIITPLFAFDRRSPLHGHLLALIDYLGHLAGLVVFVVGPIGSGQSIAPDAISGRVPIFFDPELAATDHGFPTEWTPIALPELLALRPARTAYLMVDCRRHLRESKHVFHEVFVRHDAILLAGGNADLLIQALRFRSAVHVFCSVSYQVAWWRHQPGVVSIIEGPFKRNYSIADSHVDFSDFAKKMTATVLCAGYDPSVTSLQALAEAIGVNINIVDVSLYDNLDAWRKQLWFMEAEKTTEKCIVIVDLTQCSYVADLLIENSLKKGRYLIQLLRGADAVSGFSYSDCNRCVSISDLLTTFVGFFFDDKLRKDIVAASQRNALTWLSSDAGWTRMWSMIRARTG